MKRYVMPIPGAAEILQHFIYHEQPYVRAGVWCQGGLIRRQGPLYGGSRIAGGIDRLGYLRMAIPGHKGLFSLHRTVWVLHFGEIADGLVVDHIDGDPSNNCIGNLRAITDAENQMNRRKARRGSTVKYIGVCSTQNGEFNAFTSEKGAPVYLGRFCDPITAARVRDAEVAKRYGPVATLNRNLFPEDFAHFAAH